MDRRLVFSEPAWRPAGQRIAFVGTEQLTSTSSVAACDTWIARIRDNSLDFDPAEPAEQKMDADAGGSALSSYDFQPATLPIVFLHGYAGAEIGCGASSSSSPRT